MTPQAVQISIAEHFVHYTRHFKFCPNNVFSLILDLDFEHDRGYRSCRSNFTSLPHQNLNYLDCFTISLGTLSARDACFTHGLDIIQNSIAQQGIQADISYNLQVTYGFATITEHHATTTTTPCILTLTLKDPSTPQCPTTTTFHVSTLKQQQVTCPALSCPTPCWPPNSYLSIIGCLTRTHPPHTPASHYHYSLCIKPHTPGCTLLRHLLGPPQRVPPPAWARPPAGSCIFVV